MLRRRFGPKSPSGLEVVVYVDVVDWGDASECSEHISDTYLVGVSDLSTIFNE